MSFEAGYRLVRGEDITAAVAAASVTGPTGPTGATGPTGPVSTAVFAALNLSTLPTSDPGGGKVWLNSGVLTVGA